MIIDQLFTRPVFESQMDPITQFASNAHEQWRRNFDPTGTKPRIKKNSDGTEGDINVPFADLHPDWQKENLAAGHAAHRAVKHFGHDMEKAAEYVHSEWMKRNPKADYNAAQHVPYDDLSDDEKEKDRVHVRTMMRLMGHHPKQGMSEVAPPGDKAERMVRHIKQGYAQDGKLTPKEKGIAFATAWKAHNAGQLDEFVRGDGPDRGNYLKELARAWYNMDFELLAHIARQGGNPMKHRVDVQETIERMLERGIHCGDGRVRKYYIGYNSDFDGVEIQSHDHYEHSDTDDNGMDIDDRTGKPWGPYDVVEFSGDELDESITEAAQGHTIEAHGVRGMDRRTWHKTFRDTDQMMAWAEKHDAEIIGTRDLEQARHHNLSPAQQGEAEGLTEMDKSQTPPGRDTGPREGPEKIAKPISKEKMVTHALDTLTKSMAKKDNKKKDVSEAYPLGYSTDPAQGKWYQEGMDAVKYGTVGNSIKEIAKKHFVPPQWLEAFTAGFRQQEEWSREGAARGFPGGQKPEPYTTSKAMSVPPTFQPNTNARGGGGMGMNPDPLAQLMRESGIGSEPLMKKLRAALIREGRVKELADDLKTMSDADFMKKYGKAKAAIRADMKRVDEKLTTSDPFAFPAAKASSGRAIDDPDVMGSLKSASEPKFDRFSKTSNEPKLDFRAGITGDDETEVAPDPNPYMQSWGGKYATGGSGEPQWRYVEKGEDPARYGSDTTVSGTGTPDWRSIAASSKSAAAPIALDPGSKNKYKFDRTTQSQVPADGSGANPNIDDATRDRARAYAAQQNAPGAALAGAMRSSGNPVDTAKSKADWRTIYNLNKAAIGSDPNRIRPGMKLKMPDGSTYSVQSGDTLSKIAAGQINELSTNRLAQYKTAAAKDAKQADQEGNVKRGDKRFSGIVQATKKQFDNDAKQVDENRAARRALMARIVNHR
jgi:LysM repeat protein